MEFLLVHSKTCARRTNGYSSMQNDSFVFLVVYYQEHLMQQIVFVEERSKAYLQTGRAATIRTLINDESFWSGTKAVHDLLKPYFVVTGK